MGGGFALTFLIFFWTSCSSPEPEYLKCPTQELNSCYLWDASLSCQAESGPGVQRNLRNKASFRVLEYDSMTVAQSFSSFVLRRGFVPGFIWTWSPCFFLSPCCFFRQTPALADSWGLGLWQWWFYSWQRPGNVISHTCCVSLLPCQEFLSGEKRKILGPDRQCQAGWNPSQNQDCREKYR